jgi:hypothetical protein
VPARHDGRHAPTCRRRPARVARRRLRLALGAVATRRRRRAPVHVRVALPRRRDRRAARRHDAGRARRARARARPRVARAPGARPDGARARPARDPRHDGDVPHELRLPGGRRFPLGIRPRPAVPVVGHRVRLRRARRAAVREPAARAGDVHEGEGRRRAGAIRRQALAPGLALRSDVAARLSGPEHVGDGAHHAGGSQGHVDAGRLPGRRLPAVRGVRTLAALRERLDVAQLADVAAATAPRVLGAQGLRRPDRHEPPHDHADGLGAGGGQSQGGARRPRPSGGVGARAVERDRAQPRRYAARTEPFWNEVRATWRDIAARRPRFTLRASPDQGQLFTPLFEYADRLDAGEPYDPEAAREFARNAVWGYLAENPPAAAATY